MRSDLLEDQAEARLIQLRRQHLRQQSKAEKRGTSSSATEYVTDAIKTSVVPMPGISLLTLHSGGPVYAPKQVSMGPAAPTRCATSCTLLRTGSRERLVGSPHRKQASEVAFACDDGLLRARLL